MAKYKHVDRQPRLIAVDLSCQLFAFGRGRAGAEESHTVRMRRRMAAEERRAQYAQRFATVEPVFGNLRSNKGLDRFTLRGRTRVDAQWKLFCLVRDIEKLANLQYAA